MTSCDERRGVAARLRQMADEHDAVHAFDSADIRTLADLINPTFRVTCKGSYTASHDFTRWQCGRCGAYSFTPQEWIAPRYCSRCGERLVRDDGCD